MPTWLTVGIVGMPNVDVSKFKCLCQRLDGKKASSAFKKNKIKQKLIMKMVNH